MSAAGRLLAEGGRASLTARRLAAEVGASTMAIYSRFGSLDEVHQAVRLRGFAALAAHIDGTPDSDDPVCDLSRIGLAYFEWAMANQELYRAMFVDRPEGGPDAGGDVFHRIDAGVRRCVDDGRFDASEPGLLAGWAGQIWGAAHGMVTVAFAELQPPERVRLLLADMLHRLAVGYGDQRSAARRSTERALAPTPRIRVASG